MFRIERVLLPLGVAALVLGALGASQARPDAWAGLALGTLFVVTATLFALTRRRVVLDHESQRWHWKKGPFGTGRSGPFEDLQRVQLRPRAVPDANLLNEPHYAIELVPVDGAVFLAFDGEDALDARRRAEWIARALRLELRDETTDPPRVHDASSLDERLRARWVEDGVDCGERPAEAREVDGRLVLPPEGAPLGWWIGLLVFATLIASLHLAALMRGADVALGFAAFASPFDIAILLALAVLLRRTLAHEEISTDPGELVARWRVGEHTLRVCRVDIDRVERLETDRGTLTLVDTGGGRLSLGRGLPPASVPWFRAKLSEMLANAGGGLPAV